MRSTLLMLSFLAAPVLADDKPAVKEIPTKDLKLAFPAKPTGTTTPDVIATAADLAKAPIFKDAAEAVGKPITIIIPPERLDEERDILARLRRGERVEHFEVVHQTEGAPS